MYQLLFKKQIIYTVMSLDDFMNVKSVGTERGKIIVDISACSKLNIKCVALRYN